MFEFLKKTKAKTSQRSLGDRGEDLAEKFLRQKGLKPVTRNYHAQGGEIDLIMHDPTQDEYVLVEVKTRKSDAFGTGLDAITSSKVKKMLKAGTDYFLRDRKMSEVPFFRIDGVVVDMSEDKPHLEHVEDIGLESF